MLHRRACDLSAEDRADLIRQLDFGPGLNDSLISRLAEKSTALDYRRRRFIYRAGEEAAALYVVVRGRVKLCRIDQAGREAVIDIISASAIFGESALYARGARENCAMTYENSRLLRIPV